MLAPDLVRGSEDLQAMPQPWAQQEMEGAAVWDRRCVRSLVAICERRFERPLVSFSKACGNALRQAAHRIGSHSKTTVDGLLRGHFQQSAARCQQAFAENPSQPVLVVQDTTDLNYTSHPATQGLGPVHTSENGRGLFAHAALALPVEGVPFGLVHLALWARDPHTHGKRRAVCERAAEATALKESQKWIDGLWGAEATLPADLPVLVIADREADIYDYFAADRRPNTDLLVRSRHPRRVLVEPPGPVVPRRGGRRLPEVLAALPSLGSFEVELPRKRGQPARPARLEVRVTSVWILPPDLRKADDALRDRKPRRVWVVEARESDAPAGVKPVHWVLLTTLSVEGFAPARQVVHYYTRRWVIEELTLVLKSGLRAERLQMDDAPTLMNTLALLYLVAWRVLHVRDTARFLPEEPASMLVTATEQAVLEAAERRPLPTARAVTRAIAHLGGFPRYPSAGEPGVRTLWEGLQRLEAAVFGWQLAHGH
jgi:hypothetical protein